MTIENWSASLFTVDLNERVDITAGVLSFRAAVRHLAKGEWDLDLSPSLVDDVMDLWPSDVDAPKLGIALQVPGQIIVSGAVDIMNPARDRSGSMSLKLQGVDEFAALSTRLVYPQPADPPPWTTSAYYQQTGQASSVISALIRNNVGDLARPERQQPGLSVIESAAGDVGTWKYRLTTVDEAVTDIATQAGLAVHVRRRLDAGLDVYVRPTVDRNNLVLDDSALGEFSLVLSAASATTPIAGGSGEGTARLFAVAGDDVTGTARREAFSDQRNIDSLPALQRSADATRASDSSATTFSGSLTSEAADRYQWRTHYDLGDTMTLRVGRSTWTADVSAVSIVIDAGGLNISPNLGIKPRHALAQLLADVNDLASRLNNVEVV